MKLCLAIFRNVISAFVLVGCFQVTTNAFETVVVALLGFIYLGVIESSLISKYYAQGHANRDLHLFYDLSVKLGYDELSEQLNQDHLQLREHFENANATDLVNTIGLLAMGLVCIGYIIYAVAYT